MERQSFAFILQKSVLKFLTLPLLVSSIAVRTSVHRTNSSSKFKTCGKNDFQTSVTLESNSAPHWIPLSSLESIFPVLLLRPRSVVVHRSLLHNRCTYCSSSHPISNSSKSESCVSEANTSFSTAQRKESVFRFSTSNAETAETWYTPSSRCLRKNT